MNRISKLGICTLAFGYAVSPIFSKTKINKQKNIVVIMADDVSPDMFSCYSKYTPKGISHSAKTPNIDKLASQGVMFKTCYASAMSGPSRTQIMTGKYGTNSGVLQNGMWLGKSRTRIYRDNSSFGKKLKDAGYATAIAGKWHAGKQKPYEKNVGFDEYCLWENYDGFSGAKEDHKTASRYWHPGIVKNHKPVVTKPSDYGPELCCNFIMDFMERSVKENKPFLAYWPTVAPHGSRTGMPTNPLRGEMGILGDSPNKEENFKRFSSLIEYMDLLVGRVVKKIEDLGVADNTIIVFLSDNGTAVTAKTRGVERGCHVVNIIAGAGVKQIGMSNELTDFSDIAPTLCDMANSDYTDNEFDGKSLMPYITGETDSHRDWIFGYISTSQIVRTKDYLLEVVNPFLDMPRGRFYYTGEHRFGEGYVRADGVAKHDKKRKYFDTILEDFPSVTKDDEFWNTRRGKRFFKKYTSPKAVKKHLYNHRDWKYYEE